MLILYVTNAHAFQYQDSVVKKEMNRLFFFWEDGKFDSLYEHLTDKAKGSVQKAVFLNKQNEIFLISRHKEFKILKCDRIDDSTFEVSFAYSLYSKPNSYKLNYSFDSIANTFQFRDYGKTIWYFAIRNKKALFNFNKNNH